MLLYRHIVLILHGLLFFANQSPVVAEDVKSMLMNLAYQRLGDMFNDKSVLESPKTQDGVTMTLSKDDKKCGDSGVPVVFLEFDVKGVRPVDTFNALADFYNQPSWDSMCNGAHNLGEFKSDRARGGALSFAAKPLSSREMYEWQVVSANVTIEEFWVVFSTLNNDRLKDRKAPASGAVDSQNCIAAYKMTKTQDGVHILMTQQINSHPYPLSARNIAAMSFGNLVSWVKAFTGQSTKQMQLGWNASRLNVPDWMVAEQVCSPEAADVDTKMALLAKAREEMNRKSSDRGSQVSQKLNNGESIQIWERNEECGVSPAVPTYQVPLWHVEFRIPEATSAEVFNRIVAKAQEASWNAQLAKATTSEYQGGARGVHELISLPSALKAVMLHQRELWEWQIANYSAENKSYLVALSSQSSHTEPKFGSDNVEAAQCMAGYEISESPKGGVQFHMVTHTNPNGLWLLEKIGAGLWEWQAKKMLVQFANDLISSSQKLAQDVKKGNPLPLDDGVLSLLSPTPPTAAGTISLSSVASDEASKFFKRFADLDIPGQLNSSFCPSEKFPQCAKALHDISLRLKSNTTAQEWSALEKKASNTLELQLQGVALAAVQWRVLEYLAQDKCAKGANPDINDNAAALGISLTTLVEIGAAMILVLIAVVIACCCGFNKRCRKCGKRCLCCSKREVRLADGLSEGNDGNTSLAEAQPTSEP